jgi:hypothetical protein
VLTSELLVVVIETPNSSRSQPLLKSLASDPRFKVVRLPACMVESYGELQDKGIEIDFTLFQTLHRRSMTPQEIGCATSHNVARKLILDSNGVGIVFEDDARIIDISTFFESVVEVLSSFTNTSGVLSLTRVVSTSGFLHKQEKIKAYKLYGNPPLAVAYALTPSAAKQLVSNNTPVNYVSDWPDSKVKFFCLNKPLVNHGDEDTKSTIDIDGDMNRLERDWGFTFQKWFLVHYLLHARKYVPFYAYYRNQFRRPLLRHLDAAQIRFLLIWESFR